MTAEEKFRLLVSWIPVANLNSVSERMKTKWHLNGWKPIEVMA